MLAWLMIQAMSMEIAIGYIVTGPTEIRWDACGKQWVVKARKSWRQY